MLRRNSPGDGYSHPTINAFRAEGHHNIAGGLRHASYEPFTRPLDLLGIA